MVSSVPRGRGQAISIISEAGIGKSSFPPIRVPEGRDKRGRNLLEAGAYSYSRNDSLPSPSWDILKPTSRSRITTRISRSSKVTSFLKGSSRWMKPSNPGPNLWQLLP